MALRRRLAATAGDAPAISIREIYQQHRRILGAPLGSRSEFRDLVACLASGRLAPVVYTTVALERIHEGFTLLATRDCFGKIAIRVDASSGPAAPDRGVRTVGAGPRS